jgi:hypothetical protein
MLTVAALSLLLVSVADQPEPPPAKAPAAAAAPAKRRIVPTVTLETRAGPSEVEARLMALLPSVNNGVMRYGPCGNRPCGAAPVVRPKPSAPSAPGVAVQGTPGPLFAPVDGSVGRPSTGVTRGWTRSAGAVPTIGCRR